MFSFVRSHRRVVSNKPVIIALVLGLAFLTFFSLSASEESDAIAINGTCGVNVNWTLETTTGTITLSGTGPTDDYGSSGVVPWSAHMNIITKVVVENGVTTIGHNLFNSCSKITSVVLSSTVKPIGNNSFQGCTSLSTLSLSSVDTVGAGAFMSCTALTTISGGNLIDIGPDAFNGCTKLVEFGNMGSIRTIGSSAFSNCTALKTMSLTSIRTIENSAFASCRALDNITLGSNLTTIGSDAFQGCIALKRITIPTSVTNIGPNAFSGCLGITEIIFNARDCRDLSASPFSNAGGSSGITVTFGNSVSNIPANLFSNNTVVRHYEIGTSVKTIGTGAFQNCNGTFAISFGDLEKIGERAFQGCSKLYEITIPATVTSIGKEAFSGCNSLSKITYNTALANGSFTSDAGIFNTPGQKSAPAREVIFGDTVKSIPEFMFKTDGYLAKVNLNKAETIGSAAFMGTSISGINLPLTVTAVNSEAFKDCESLTSIVISNEDTQIQKSAFSVARVTDTHVTCYRKSIQNDYDWLGDNRRVSFSWMHNEGEYSGIMEIVFDTMSFFVGANIANIILDFFIDNYSLNILESIDLGSKDNNILFLCFISLLLSLLLYWFLYIGRTELVRSMEIVMSIFAILVVAYSAIRMTYSYGLENWWVDILIFCFAVGPIVPIWAAVTSMRRPRKTYPGEKRFRIYSMDVAEFKLTIMSPWRRKITYADGRERKFPLLGIILGIEYSLIFTVCMVISHIPVYLLSFLMSRYYSFRDKSCNKHTTKCICTECGSLIDMPNYECPGCGVEHVNLKPGKFGLRKSECECSEKLWCTVKKKRWNLYVERCPSCHAKLSTKESEPFSISMVGGEGAGKTSMIMGFMKQFEGEYSKTHNMQTEYFGSADTSASVKMYERGERINTPDGKLPPNAIRFNKDDRQYKSPKAFYFYDIYGKEFSARESRRFFETQYAFNTGFIFIINALDFKKGDGWGSSRQPFNVLSSFMTICAETANLRPGDKLNVPIAVVVNYSKQAGLAPCGLNDIMSREHDKSVVAFLENVASQHNLIQKVKETFKDVRFFACNAVGDEDDSPLVPALWIASTANEKILK